MSEQKELEFVCIATPPKASHSQEVEIYEFKITTEDWEDEEPEEGETFEDYVDYVIGEEIAGWEQKFYSAVVLTKEQYQNGLAKK